MIIGLYLLFFGGGGGSLDLWILPSNFNDQVEIVITADDRQDDIKDLYDQMKEYGDNHLEKEKKLADQIIKGADSQASTDEDLLSLFNAYADERHGYENKMLKGRMDLAKKINREEWEKIFAPKETKE